MKYFNNINFRTYLYFILFLLSIIYYFGYSFFGLDFSDTFFHLNNSEISEIYNINFLTVLSTLFIKLILKFVTHELVCLRIINAIIKIAPLFIFYYYLKTTKRSFLLWTVIILIIISTNNNTFILGYDTFSVFILSIILLVLFKNSTYLSYPTLFLLSILSCCSVLIRFPNIIVIVIVFFYLFFLNDSKHFYSFKNIRKPFLYLLLSVIFLLLFYFIFYGNLDTLLNSNNLKIRKGGHHGIIKLLRYYVRDFGKILFFSFEIILFIWLFIRFKLESVNKIVNVLILLFLHLLFFYKFVSISDTRYGFSYYLSSLMIVFIIHNLFFNKFVIELKTKLYFSIFFIFIFIEPFGSNTGLLKASPIFILFPFIYKFSELNSKKVYFIILITLIPFAILEKTNSIYQDSKLSKLTRIMEIDKIESIRTSKKRADFVNSVNTEYEVLVNSGYSVFFYGDKSHIFRYLYNDFDLNINDYYQPVDELFYLKHIIEVTKKTKKSIVFIVNDYRSEMDENKESLLETKLIENNFTSVHKGEIVYYKMN